MVLASRALYLFGQISKSRKGRASDFGRLPFKRICHIVFEPPRPHKDRVICHFSNTLPNFFVFPFFIFLGVLSYVSHERHLVVSTVLTTGGYIQEWIINRLQKYYCLDQPCQYLVRSYCAVMVGNMATLATLSFSIWLFYFSQQRCFVNL